MHFTLVLWIFLLVSTAVAGPGSQKPTDGDGPTDEQIKSLKRSQMILVYSRPMGKEGVDFPYVPAIFLGVSQPGNVQFLPFSDKYSGPLKHKANFGDFFPDKAGKIIKFQEHSFTLEGTINLRIGGIRPSLIRIPDPPAVDLDLAKVETLATQAAHNERSRNRERIRRKKQREQGQNPDHRQVEVENQESSSANPNIDAGQHTEWKFTNPFARSSSTGDHVEPEKPPSGPRRGSF